MIRLSGKEPGREIAIEFVGPAPGEKLHEELGGDGESVTPSQHPKIDLITRPPVDAEWLEAELALLEALDVLAEQSESPFPCPMTVGEARENRQLLNNRLV